MRDGITSWKRERRTLAISPITYAETLSYEALTDKDITLARNFLDEFFVVPMDAEIAKQSAYFRRLYRVTLPDATIAATAYAHNLPLVTRDKTLHKIREIIIVAV